MTVSDLIENVSHTVMDDGTDFYDVYYICRDVLYYYWVNDAIIPLFYIIKKYGFGLKSASV
jgi:hypothetical protein